MPLKVVLDTQQRPGPVLSLISEVLPWREVMILDRLLLAASTSTTSDVPTVIGDDGKVDELYAERSDSVVWDGTRGLTATTTNVDDLVGAIASDTDGELVCLDGKERWRVMALNADHRPTLARARVYVVDDSDDSTVTRVITLIYGNRVIRVIT